MSTKADTDFDARPDRGAAENTPSISSDFDICCWTSEKHDIEISIQ
jgi:hypothetical protein